MTSSQIDQWRKSLGEIRSDIERAQQSKGMAAETAWFDAIAGFEALDASFAEAWIEAIREEVRGT